MARAKAAEAEPVDFSAGDSLMVDLNDVEDASFELLPNALYPCVISECVFDFSQSAGNPMWSLVLEVTDGEYTGRKLYTHLVFAGKGMPYTKRQLARIAPELFDGPFNPEDDDVVATMPGKNVSAKVSKQKWEGEWRNNIRDLFAARDEGGFNV